jgi:hypothetical protein
MTSLNIPPAFTLNLGEGGFSTVRDSGAMKTPLNGDSFMRVKVQNVEAALHPSEAVVQIKTISGIEYVVVDKRSIVDNSLSVGSPVGQDGDNWLVELPRETMTGTWRVWVKKNSVIQETPKARVA